MFTISKLIWLAIILLVIWNFFRIIEKRQALKDKNDNNTVETEKKSNKKIEPVQTIYCSNCATFTDDKGCNQTDCVFVNQSNG